MLAELKMTLDQENIDFKQLSSLHGVLMESIHPEYAEKLHQQHRNPYSQTLLKEDGKVIWVVKTMTKEAYDQIIEPLYQDNFSEFKIRHNNISLHIIEKELRKKQIDVLFQEFYKESAPKYFELEFLTPTAFKSKGRYHCYPASHFIFQSLMFKFDTILTNMELWDQDTLEQLETATEISKYKLMTVPFPLEGIRISGFRGQITFHLLGADTMARFVRLLLRFGEYSGIGIKTSMGMGAFRLIEQIGRKDGKDDRK